MFTSFAVACVVPTADLPDPTPGCVLDAGGLPAAIGAYSLRKLRGAYTGPAIRIQRVSDNTFTNVGFDVNGDLNLSTITTFGSGTTCYVTRFYDQTGTWNAGTNLTSGKDLLQNTVANMFRIYASGAVETLDGKPVLYAVDENRYMVTTVFAEQAALRAAAALVGAMADNTTANSARFISFYPSTTTLNDTDVSGIMLIARKDSTEVWGTRRASTWAAVADAAYLDDTANTGLQQVTAIVNNSSYQLEVDGEAVQGTYVAASNLLFSRIGIGYRGASGAQSQPAQRIAEVIPYATLIGPSEASYLANNQRAYWGTATPPGTPTTGTGIDFEDLGYEIIYEEEFDVGHDYTIDATTYENSVDPDHWSIYGVPAGTTPGNDGVGFRDPGTISVANSAMRIAATGLTSGALTKKNVDQVNRRYSAGEVRFRIPQGVGYGAKINLFPTSGNWPYEGEIILLAIPGGTGNNTLISEVLLGTQSTETSVVGDWTQWHVVSWTWSESAITFYLDGQQYWQVTNTAYQPTGPMRLVIRYDVGDGDPIPVRTAATPQPSVLEIDRITLAKPVDSELPPTGTGFTDLPNFNLIFDENFDTPCAEGAFLTTYTNWGAYPRSYLDTYGGEKNPDGTYKHPNAKSHYEPNILSVSNSTDGVTGTVLKKRLHVGTAPLAGAPADNLPWVACPYPKLPGKNNCAQTYGRYEARLRVVGPVQGYKTAWLLWNTRTYKPVGDPLRLTWPYAGETDWPEGQLTGQMHVFHHNYRGTSGGDQVHFAPGAVYTDWHDVALEWTPGRCEFFIDGDSFGVVTSRVCPDEMVWLLQTETSLGNPRPIAGQQCVLEIARCGVWSYAP